MNKGVVDQLCKPTTFKPEGGKIPQSRLQNAVTCQCQERYRAELKRCLLGYVALQVELSGLTKAQTSEDLQQANVFD